MIFCCTCLRELNSHRLVGSDKRERLGACAVDVGAFIAIRQLDLLALIIDDRQVAVILHMHAELSIDRIIARRAGDLVDLICATDYKLTLERGNTSIRRGKCDDAVLIGTAEHCGVSERTIPYRRHGKFSTIQNLTSRTLFVNAQFCLAVLHCHTRCHILRSASNNELAARDVAIGVVRQIPRRRRRLHEAIRVPRKARHNQDAAILVARIRRRCFVPRKLVFVRRLKARYHG